MEDALCPLYTHHIKFTNYDVFYLYANGTQYLNKLKNIYFNETRIIREGKNTHAPDTFVIFGKRLAKWQD